MVVPLTVTLPSRITRSLARRDATPASARNFCSRTAIAGGRTRRVLILGPMLNRPSRKHPGLDVRFGFAQAGDAIAGLPKAALLEDFHPLKAFEHVSFCARRARGAQTAML